ncbi:phosphopentomutase [Phaeobacter gallaeciensis]|uniref:phosphopentomutase n=1 Tax=Phaeobacter gallaeciensis TaxID=60890 RepID=UPI00237F749B|nr:phosphopentomutase [Phaeobacter gallaeciensis]MDE4303748.1 phosphopentomutase [Phaeobacter gallaeciensis]MDE4307771.1 phosphopentomutase [Phaeobacter gallaeciensis]MDE4312229.1 phosphopentomutase [Phaeobacter gallaeciensis]MDE4316700.1 phosphopentomutase [Phaeobacter gallaeciensis]MDE4321163.1 phosphopentomutase [Phaeobacter gallaeciensis]
MARAFLVVMDSVGIGGAPDADRFFNGDLPDLGANTLAHIAQACTEGRAENGRSGPLYLPNLDRLGLGSAMRLASAVPFPGLTAEPEGLWGCAAEVSLGKDTPSGHWELAGLPVPWNWHFFPDETPAFPADLSAFVAEAAGAPGILGDCHASGTDIIARHGAEHMKTCAPICYTSADSVFQIAAHEESFGLNRLLDLCRAVAPRLHAMKVGRVIARPFVGTPESGFNRTTNRRDFAITPPAKLLTNWVQDAGQKVHAIGKIGDIFTMSGIDTLKKGPDAELMQHLAEAVETAEEGSLTFANFVEFDSLYGHRRDVSGYARALEWFDHEIGKILPRLRVGDILVLTADHGNDPSWPGTDHTREQVPVLVAAPGQTLGQAPGAGSLGARAFADVGVSVARHLGVASSGPGRSFL